MSIYGRVIHSGFVTARLSHQNILGIQDKGLINGRCFFIGLLLKFLFNYSMKIEKPIIE